MNNNPTGINQYTKDGSTYLVGTQRKAIITKVSKGYDVAKYDLPGSLSARSVAKYPKKYQAMEVGRIHVLKGS